MSAESGKRKTSYPLAILLQTVSTILPFVGVIFLVGSLLNGKNGEASTVGIVVFIATFLQWVVLRRPLKNMYTQAVQDNEYDENGISKKKKFENLTRTEREQMDLQKASQMESLLSSTVLKKIQNKGSENPDKDLADLIGIYAVKEKTNELVARMKFEADARKEKGRKNRTTTNSMSGRHMVFYGSAGTGKTTLARIITGFLYQYGYIKQNKCVEVDGNFLKAGEDSATKTRLLIQRAYGGVLFIDEAYTIIDGSGGYGKEAVATLIKEMEDNRDKLVVILAGYQNDIKRLLDSNEGFKSRIKEYFHFEDYTNEEMKQIFEKMAHSSGFVVSGEAMDNFAIRCEKERKLSSFGNGRTARNILDESIDCHALNYGKGLLRRTVVRNEEAYVIENEESKYVLCGCDVKTTPNKAVLS